MLAVCQTLWMPFSCEYFSYLSLEGESCGRQGSTKQAGPAVTQCHPALAIPAHGHRVNQVFLLKDTAAQRFGTLLDTAQRAWHQRLRDFFAPTGGGRSDGGKAPERWHVWVALNAWLVYQRVEPARAEDAKAAYELLFAQLQSYEKDELRKTQESLEARVG